jgi:putative intracellular protease/amidase
MKAYLYVLNTLADWEIGYITAELYSGRFLDKNKPPIQLIKIGDTDETIKTMGGISISPEDCIDNINFKENNLLILPGADTWLEERNKKIINIIPELLNRNVVVAAICGATIALAKNGILNNRKHTSNAIEILKMTCPEYTGEKNFLDKPVVTYNN